MRVKTKSQKCVVGIDRRRSSLTLLVSPFAGNHRARRLQKDLKVEPECPAPCVLQIQPHHVIEVRPATPFDLPQTCDSRLDLQASGAVPDVIGLELVFEWRPSGD